MTIPKVILIGGTSGAGKSTLGKALAHRLDRTSLSVDDLMTAAQVATTAESHPGLHVMKRLPSLEYFTTTPVEQLRADANIQHEATRVIVSEIIRRHVDWGSPIVMDGWHMRPQWVSELDSNNLASFWLVANPDVLETRERANTDWLSGSSDPERMLGNFLGRSLWYNDLIRAEATAQNMNVLHQDGTVTVDLLCEQVLSTFRAT